MSDVVGSVSAILLDEQRVVRQRPLNLSEQDEHLFAHEFVRDFPAVRAIRTNIGFVDGHRLVLIWEQLPDDVAYANRVRQIGKCASILLRGWRNRMTARGSFWITNSWSPPYFHWICDVLPKLELLSRSETPATVIAPPPSACCQPRCRPSQPSAFPCATLRSMEYWWTHSIFRTSVQLDICARN